MRGYSVIALKECKTPENIGGALRAASIYGASLMVLAGKRPKKAIRHVTNTAKSWRHTPHLLVENVFDGMPFDCVPVAVDKVEGAVPLWDFQHPQRAFYIFGPEDGTLGAEVLKRCKHKVYVPMDACMNLAASVNVVLYDRLAKVSTAGDR